MGLFGNSDEDEFANRYKQAIRNRLLSEVKAKQMAGGGAQVSPASIVNNLYGGHAYGGGGVMDRMGGTGGPMGPGGAGAGDEDPFDYLVDITKEDIPGEGEGAKPRGWTKKVHRYREKKK